MPGGYLSRISCCLKVPATDFASLNFGVDKKCAYRVGMA